VSAPILIPIIALLVVVGALVILGMAAAEWGVDSRSPLSDDHNR
jgi:hypothetical protein